MAELVTRNGALYLQAFGEENEVLKGWESFGGWYWFATELNDDGVHFGYVQGTYPEWGYFDEAEIMSLKPHAWEIRKQDLPYAGRRNGPEERLGNDHIKKMQRRGGV